MELPLEIFKAYDIRGIVGDTLTAPIVEQIGWAIGDISIEAGHDSVVIGWDGRSSGPEYSEALGFGIRSAGCHVVMIGMVPTPLTYFASHFLNIKSAVAITGTLIAIASRIVRGIPSPNEGSTNISKIE